MDRILAWAAAMLLFVAVRICGGPLGFVMVTAILIVLAVSVTAVCRWICRQVCGMARNKTVRGY